MKLTIWFEAKCDFHLYLDVIDNGTGPRPFNDYGNRDCMGSFGSNKIDFSSPHEGFQEIGYNRDNRRNFLWALLYITIVIEVGVEGAKHLLGHCPTFPWA